MRRRAAFAAIVLSLPAAAHAAPRWTFCVAAAGSGSDVWISDVFAVERLRGLCRHLRKCVGLGSHASAHVAGPIDVLRFRVVRMRKEKLGATSVAIESLGSECQKVRGDLCDDERDFVDDDLDRERGRNAVGSRND